MAAPLRALEFYSGIGGMHYAADECNVDCKIVGAFEINPAANAVYKHNFPDTPLLQRNIESLTLKMFNSSLAADLWLMSPPCQPYTRQGHQQGSEDARSKSFQHLLRLLPQLKEPPRYILIENVKGFETSDTRAELVKVLSENQYGFQEFLLTPNQFAVPNQRLRYFLLAKRSPLEFATAKTSADTVWTTIPGDSECHEAFEFGRRPEKEPTEGDNNTSSSGGGGGKRAREDDAGAHADAAASEDAMEEAPSYCHTIAEYLDTDRRDFAPHMVNRKTMLTKGVLFDILVPSDRRSCCFTKAYAHYAEGTGSVLQTNLARKYQDVFKHMMDLRERAKRARPEPDASAGAAIPPGAEEDAALQAAEDDVMALGVRYFTETEIARLHCYPARFEFPETTTVKSAYRLLGNSLNVKVVAHLLNYLLAEPAPHDQAADL